MSAREDSNRADDGGSSDCGNAVRCRPFVKWVGGKSQLLSELVPRLPRKIGRYYEPFVGGGALFFALQPKHARLSDLNQELINVYSAVRDNADMLVESLRQHRYEQEYFYSTRNIDRSPEFQHWTALARASRFIYLNKTCFNGLYRVNSKGFFNTPFGRYTNPTIVDSDNIKACSRALSGVELAVDSFLSIEDRVDKGDFVYFDPPYVPLSSTSSFTGYQQGGFDIEMQRSLRDLCVRLDSRGVNFMLSNSSAPLVLDLYSAFNLERVGATRSINATGNKRGKVDEVIVRNYR